MARLPALAALAKTSASARLVPAQDRSFVARLWRVFKSNRRPAIGRPSLRLSLTTTIPPPFPSELKGVEGLEVFHPR
jgi:hypothetical protein